MSMTPANHGDIVPFGSASGFGLMRGFLSIRAMMSESRSCDTRSLGTI